MAKTMIAATTSAAVSDSWTVNLITPTFVAVGTYAAGEDATMQIHNGTDWVDVIIEGVTQVLDEQNTVLTVYGKGTYRFNKDASAAASGVALVGV